MTPRVIAIVPSAGLGRRFGSDQRKTFALIDDKPLFLYTLHRLHRSVSITEVIPVVRPEDVQRAEDLIASEGLGKVRRVVAGGKERQDSVSNAVNLVQDDGILMVHDGVRPFVSVQLIQRLIEGLESVDGVIPALPVQDTLKTVNGESCIRSTVPREKFFTVQTPQVFPIPVVRDAFERASADGFYGTDESSLVERIGGKVKIVPGDPFNIKITTPGDMKMAELIHHMQEAS